MLIANFCNGKNKAIVSGAWQYDYGQKLYIHGLELPEVVEIGFSLTETGGMDYPRFAITKDGVTEVAIPDEMMEGNDVESDYRIYAFVFVEDEKQESGQTIKSIEIRVKSRPKRWMDDETGDNFSEIVKAVRDLVEEYKKSGVSDEQVRAALNDYLADHPIDTLTEDEVRAIVNAMLGDVTQTHFEKVDVLPDNGKENIIYLVPAENTEEQNIYDEYIFLNGIPELIGTTKINLEGYATKEELRQLSETVNNKLDSSKLPEAVNDALSQAKESGEFDGYNGTTPHIGDNGNWFIGTIDTGVKAKGEDGVGIDRVVEDSNDTMYKYTIYLTNGEYFVLKAKHGISPTVKKTVMTNGVRVTITDANGDKVFDISNGEDGKTPHIGENGNWFIGETDTGVKAEGSVTGGEVDLTGYATENFVKEYAQPKGDYLTQHQSLEGYAKTANHYTKNESDDKYQPKGNYLTEHQSLADYAKKSEIPKNASQVGAEASGTAQAKVTEHNTSETSHNDIRLLIEGLTNRLNTIANSDDTTLDQMAEVVAYIKSNKSLIDGITTNKVSVSDIIDNLTSSVSNKPLSAKQGVQLKALIDAIVVPTLLSQLGEDSTHRTVTDTEKQTWNSKSDFSGAFKDLTGKPTTLSGYGITDAATKEKVEQLEETIADLSSTIKQEVMDELLSSGEIPDSGNHFNKDAIMVGYRINSSTGAIQQEGISAISNYIDVEFGKTVYINNLPAYTSSNGSIRRITFFEEDKATPIYTADADHKIAHGNTQHSIAVPLGAKYLVFDLYSTMQNVDFAATLDISRVMVTFDQYRDYEVYKEPGESVLNIEFSKPTKDKQMLIFGDSITETATMNDDGSNYVEGERVNWLTFAKTLLETDNFKNYAKNGATYKDQSGAEYRQSVSNQIALALADSSNDTAEIIVLSLGTNDGESNDDYSTAMAVETVEALDRTKLHQAIRYAMWKLKTKYPNAKCFVATPIQRKAREQDASLRSAIIAMGNRYNFKVIDAEFESGIIRENEVLSGEGVDLYDGLHPNENGAMKMAELYSSVILNSFSFNAKC